MNLRKRERLSQAKKSHGQANSRLLGTYATPTYRAWTSMIERCENPKFVGYARYGGRGIQICDRWRNDFAAFLADMGERPPLCSLDRIRNDGNYEPGNCRWASRREQSRNTSRNRRVTFRGETLCLAEWAEKTGLTACCILGRLRRGWSAEAALTVPNCATNKQRNP